MQMPTPEMLRAAIKDAEKANGIEHDPRMDYSSDEIRFRFGVRIKSILAVLKTRKILQRQIGEMIGVTEMAMNAYTSGRNRPKLEVMQRLADVLGLSVFDMTPESRDYGVAPAAPETATSAPLQPLSPAPRGHLRMEYLADGMTRLEMTKSLSRDTAERVFQMVRRRDAEATSEERRMIGPFDMREVEGGRYLIGFTRTMPDDMANAIIEMAAF